MEKWEIIELYMEADEETKQQMEMLLDKYYREASSKPCSYPDSSPSS
jgi:hypothetical protein